MMMKTMKDYNVSEAKARSNSKLFHNVIERLEKASPDTLYSHDDVSMMLRDSISKQSLIVHKERESLIQQLNLIDEVLSPIEKEMENAKEMSHVKSVRSGLTFVSVIMMQFALSQYGTYIAFSWDIMEPIMACVTLSDAVAGYIFWLWCGKPWDLDSWRRHYYEKELRKRLARLGINSDEVDNLLATRKQLMKELTKDE